LKTQTSEENSNTNPELQKIIEISTIKLGLCRVPINGDKNEYNLVPVWDFRGSLKIHNTKTNEITCLLNNITDIHCFLTINAIDGTIIDREYGN
jgi:hypothetical protein